VLPPEVLGSSSPLRRHAEPGRLADSRFFTVLCESTKAHPLPA